MRKRRRKNRMIRLGILAVLVVVLIAAAILFRAGTVDVYGNTRHSSDEITASLTDGFLSGNTLYLMWKYRNGAIPEAMPYLSSIHIQMRSPSHLAVTVTEKEPVAYMDQDGYVYIDSEGTVLQISDQTDSTIPLVTGVSTEEVSLYQKLPTQSSAQLRTILSLTQLLQEHDLVTEEIRFSDNSEITAYIDGVEAELGQDEYLEEKIANLSKILPRLDGQKGVLHLENFTGRNETVSFSPFDDSEVPDGITPAEDAADGTEEGAGGTEDGSGDTQASEGDAAEADPDTAAEDSGEDDSADEEEQSPTIAMVFNSSGTLVYNVHISNGVVVDQYGNEVPGVTVNEDGNVVDAYMNVIDPATGDLVQ